MKEKFRPSRLTITSSSFSLGKSQIPSQTIPKKCMKLFKLRGHPFRPNSLQRLHRRGAVLGLGRPPPQVDKEVSSLPIVFSSDQYAMNFTIAMYQALQQSPYRASNAPLQAAPCLCGCAQPGGVEGAPRCNGSCDPGKGWDNRNMELG